MEQTQTENETPKFLPTNVKIRKIYKVGEIWDIEGEKMKVVKVTPKKILLRRL